MNQISDQKHLRLNVKKTEDNSFMQYSGDISYLQGKKLEERELSKEEIKNIMEFATDG